MKLNQIETGADYASSTHRIGPRVRVLDAGPFVDPRPSHARSGGFTRREDMQPLTLADGTTVDTAYVRPSAKTAHARTYYVAVITVTADGIARPDARVEFVLPRVLDCPWAEHEERVARGNAAAAAAAAFREQELQRQDTALAALVTLAGDAGVTITTPADPWTARGQIRATRQHGTTTYTVDRDVLGSLLQHAARTGWTPPTPEV